MKILLILFLSFGLLLAGCVSNSPQVMTQKSSNDSMQKLPVSDSSMQKTQDSSSSMNKTTAPSMNKSDSGAVVNKSDPKMMEQPSVGYVSLEKSKFDAARSSGKYIFLEFHANWCPTCVAQKPALVSAFTDLKSSNVVAFQVNYRDSETDDFERLIAKEYGISYQHTHVLLNPEGSVILKSNQMWTKEDVLNQLSQAGVR